MRYQADILHEDAMSAELARRVNEDWRVDKIRILLRRHVDETSRKSLSICNINIKRWRA